MTTHKDRPHATNCRACLFPISGGGFTEAPCNCAEGTRWHGNGARIEDAIAIQGIATFFARLQPAVAVILQYGDDDWSRELHWAAGVDRLGTVAGSKLYASPVTPAAQTVAVPDDWIEVVSDLVKLAAYPPVACQRMLIDRCLCRRCVVGRARAMLAASQKQTRIP